MNKLNLIELNEINFELVDKYVSAQPGRYKGLEKLLSLSQYKTRSEETYHLIEPWIQWASVHTRKTFSEHKIFRLGDIVNCKHQQIFEMVEQAGFTVGCISPMNAENKLKNPKFFIPDPWTDTDHDGSWLSKNITTALRQAVNDNAKNSITFKTYISILFALVFYTSISHWKIYIRLFRLRHKKWNKALFLDLLLADIFIKYTKRRPADFSTLFLNSFAHIQHHYMLNSKYYDGDLENKSNYISKMDDPLLDAIQVFDKIINKIINNIDGKKIFATGLRQVPVPRKITYYRLNNHYEFLCFLGLRDFHVEPRMTRDFKITFNNDLAKRQAIDILSILSFNNERIFSEIDDRGDSLFVVLTYSLELSEDDVLSVDGVEKYLSKEFIFVAHKNGHHDGLGYVFTDIETNIIRNDDTHYHVKEIGNEIVEYFKIKREV